MTDFDKRSFPDVLAVDPNGCGCTECLIGEYVPFERWVALATPGDVKALMVGDVKNNTYDYLRNITVMGAYEYSDRDTKDYLVHVLDELLSDEKIAIDVATMRD